MTERNYCRDARRDSFDPGAAMDEGRIILLDLDRSRLGLVGSRMTGLLYLTRFWTAAFERATRRPFIVLADEAHTFTTTALTAIAAEGRKFGLGLVVAHQHPEQLDADLREALDGNAGTVIAQGLVGMPHWVDQPGMGVGTAQRHPRQAAGHQATQESQPTGPVLGTDNVQAENFPLTVGVHSDRRKVVIRHRMHSKCVV